MVGFSDNFFPSHMNNNIKNVEEERRLFYVGITRAKKWLYFVASKSEIPISRFIKEIYDDCMYVNYPKHKVNQQTMDLFNVSNKDNIIKLAYGVTEVVQTIKPNDLEEMRNLELIYDVVLNKNVLFDSKLTFTEQIKKGNYEADFGEFADKDI